MPKKPLHSYQIASTRWASNLTSVIQQPATKEIYISAKTPLHLDIVKCRLMLGENMMTNKVSLDKVLHFLEGNGAGELHENLFRGENIAIIDILLALEYQKN